MDINEPRKTIEEVDRQMANLFVQRMEASRAIAAYKREHGLPVEDQQREMELSKEWDTLIGDDDMRSFFVRFMQDTLEISKLWQHRLIDGECVSTKKDIPVGMNMDFKRKLPIPMEVKEMCPLTPEIADVVKKRTNELKAVFAGESDKLVLIIGPCSADNEESVIDYVTRLVPVQEKVADKIIIVPRLYTNKPRTTGDGYKGLVHQPDPMAQPDLFRGIIATRELHLRAVKETGFVCADEMLYPENYKYLDDLLGYTAVGARSVENQQHRLTASAVGCPVGMKNPTSGDLTVMMNAITAAQHQHDFIYRGWEGHSLGNPYAHAILRGYVNRQGVTHPNYHYETLLYLVELYSKWNVANPAVIVDCNHSNSGKNPFEQPRIMEDVLQSCRYNSDIKQLVKGFMVESYIEDGNQPVDGGVYGKSITDACLGWEKSERLIYAMAELL